MEVRGEKGKGNRSANDILAGPMNGAAENAAMGTPLSSFLHRSASVPPTSVMGAEKAMPSMARLTSSVSMFFATAQGMTKMTASNKVEPLHQHSSAWMFFLQSAREKHGRKEEKGLTR
jgi:hypothetical protein